MQNFVLGYYSCSYYLFY